MFKQVDAKAEGTFRDCLKQERFTCDGSMSGLLKAGRTPILFMAVSERCTAIQFKDGCANAFF